MSANNKIHIVSFNVPYPANYGGVIDVFFKIKALFEEGAEIYLHCFTYGRERAEILNKYCKKVYYYKRKKSLDSLFHKLPFIVATRKADELLHNLLETKAPILFEGLHTCFYINHPKLKGYRKIIRMHNVEHQYYGELAKSETNPLKRIYFKWEAKKLKKFESQIKHASAIATISKADQEYFNPLHGNSLLVSGFHGYNNVSSISGKGEYILFHGNLGVAENQKAVDFILDKVKIQEHFQLIIAGKNPSSELLNLQNKFEKLKVIANPTEDKMQDLIKNAHICFIPTFQSTGLKLKLLGSLFASRFVLTNTPMVKNTGLENLCHVFDDPEKLKSCIFKLFLEAFSEKEIEIRKLGLEESFSNKMNAKKLFTLITSNNS